MIMLIIRVMLMGFMRVFVIKFRRLNLTDEEDNCNNGWYISDIIFIKYEILYST
jgi:hypothetical protein